jgi:hypothetical protein
MFRVKSFFLFSTILILTTFMLTAGAFCQSELWGDLKPGPYGVGFKTIEKFDYSRGFRSKTDYFGAPQEGNRARPIQVCFWYPARTGPDDFRLTYGEYVFPYPEDIRFFDALTGIQNREVGYLNGIMGDQGVVVSLMSAEMGAVKDAESHEGPFPLIIYHQDLARSYCENAILCEFLASHGFVVATAHQFGANTMNPEASYSDLLMLIRDKEFVLGNLHDLPYIDHDKTGVLGHAHGGLAALNMRMCNSEIDAVACLEGWSISKARSEFAMQSPLNNFMKMAVPLLVLYGEAEFETNLSYLDSLKYSERRSFSLAAAPPLGFTHYPMFSVLVDETQDSIFTPLRQTYMVLCDYVLNFFKAELYADQEAAEFMNNEPIANGIQAALPSAHQYIKQELPPTPEQFMGIINNNGASKAEEIYHKFKALDPELVLFPEANLNFIGYGLLRNNNMEDALKIFRLNTEAYPNSANTWDSLAETLEAMGRTEESISCTKKALEKLPTDEGIDDNFREIIRQGCQQRLERLGG